MSRIVGEHPFTVSVTDPHWITLGDGTRIACTLWRPVTDARVPVVVEIIPYRRRDGTVFRDLETNPWLAGRGIACCRVDIRGSGDSDGVLEDEYLPREQEDAVEIIAALAAEHWCNGAVGMTGISWGGFNALQVAARRPPALKAIATLCSTDDRYADDVHYMGGALLTEDEMWSNFMLVKNAMPPDPRIVGPRWREMWAARLEANRSWSEHWLAHQRRDDYWRQGSVCEDFAAIECAVLAVGGWEDSYSNSVHRLLEGLRCPKQAIMGPWTHAYPHRSRPGPRIGYLQEVLRWWRHWLCGEPTGIMDEPLYRVFMLGDAPPRPWYDEHVGSWAAEESWPSPRIEPRRMALTATPNGAGALSEAEGAAPGPTLSARSPATAGTDCGRWGGYGSNCPDLAIDQRREDGQALCFDGPPLAQDLALLGAPTLDLEVTLDVAQANLVARLCAVAPDGTSAMLTYGVLNLGHRESHEHRAPCPVGRPFGVRLALNDLGRVVPKGHRLRLALQTQHWPILWPQPTLATLAVTTGASSLTLPVRPPSPRDAEVRFEAAEIAPPAPTETLRPGRFARTVEDDVATGVRTIRLLSDNGETRLLDRDTITRSWNTDTFSIHPDDPLSARLETEYLWALRMGADAPEVESRGRTELTADATHFQLTWRIEAREDGRLVHSRQSTRRIPRDGV